MDSIPWTAWGASQPELSAPARALLKPALGPLTPQRPVSVTEVALPPSRLPAPIKNLFVEALGAAGVLDDDETRARHAGGQAYLDLVRRRSGDAADAPDAVLLPPTTAAVADVLSICSRERVAVVPWGGGTSVVGGLSALRGSCESVVALDLGRLDRLLAVDPESLTATFEPGVRTPDAERALSAHGLTIGHVPQSFERATLGGYVVTRSAGQASSGVGRIDDLVVGCRLQTPSGELVLGPVAGSAAGPDLRRLVLGSEGIFGVVTEVTLRVRRLPDVTHYEGWVARDWDHGLRILRRLAQDGPRPDIVRLSDPDETRISMAMSGTAGWQRRALGGYLRLRGVRTGCLLIVGYEGGRRDVHHRRREVRRVLRADHAVPLGTGAGQSWERHRFAAPYLRDTLLDAGVLAETLETATTWTQLPALYLAVRSALAAALAHDDRPPLVGCHVSHLYPTGGSLYFTVLARAVPGNEIEQWSAAKAAANRAIAGAGGTATHHHAVGTAHQDIVTADLGGAVGVTAMRAVKAALDPAGIMNPGKLLPGPPDV